MKLWPTGVARAAEIIVGVTYLVAAVLKAWNFNGFLPQIHAYQIVESNASLLVVAFVALALETGLGVCLVLGTPWRRLVFGLSTAMLVFFTGVILYAWQVNGLEDCGCFGDVKVTPPQAIGKNVVLIGLTALAWYGLVTHPAVRVGRAALRGAAALVLALASCLAVIPQLGFTTSKGGGPEPPATAGPDARTPGPFAAYTVESEYGEVYELGEGEYLVALLSMTCDHCMESVPQLNEFMFDATLPPLVAICLEPEAGSMEEFRMLTQPQFPMLSLGDKSLKFFPLLESAASPPRLVFVRDGASVVSWDEEMPDYDSLMGALAEAGFAQSDNTEGTE